MPGRCASHWLSGVSKLDGRGDEAGGRVGRCWLASFAAGVGAADLGVVGGAG